MMVRCRSWPWATRPMRTETGSVPWAAHTPKASRTWGSLCWRKVLTCMDTHARTHARTHTNSHTFTNCNIGTYFSLWICQYIAFFDRYWSFWQILSFLTVKQHMKSILDVISEVNLRPECYVLQYGHNHKNLEICWKSKHLIDLFLLYGSRLNLTTLWQYDICVFILL